jgi:hypothetical protein
MDIEKGSILFWFCLHSIVFECAWKSLLNNIFLSTRGTSLSYFFTGYASNNTVITMQTENKVYSEKDNRMLERRTLPA